MEVYDQVIYIPLGQYFRPSAWRKSVSGVLDGPATPVFLSLSERLTASCESTTMHHVLFN